VKVKQKMKKKEWERTKGFETQVEELLLSGKKWTFQAGRI
jgi:hypothetical protein